MTNDQKERLSWALLTVSILLMALVLVAVVEFGRQATPRQCRTSICKLVLDGVFVCTEPVDSQTTNCPEELQ